MSKVDFPIRLADRSSSQLRAAVRDYRSEHGDAASVARLAERLTQQLAAASLPRPAAPGGWLLGVSLVASAAVLYLASVSPTQPHPMSTGDGAEPAARQFPSAVGGGVGVEPRLLATEAPIALLLSALRAPREP